MSLNLFNEWLSNDFVRAFSWTLIHSLWQGLAAAIVAGIIILLTRRSKAVIRYNLLSATLVLFFSINVSTFIWLYKSYQSSSLPSISSTVISEVRDAGFYVPAEKVEVHIYSTLSDAFVLFYEQHAPVITLIWCIIFLFQSIKLIGGFYYIQTIRTHKISPVPLEWKEILQSLCKRLHIAQPILFHQSEKINTPVVLGYLKPTILFPLGMLANLPPEQVETILLHELAHIKRKDYVFNLIQSLTEAIFFFNPPVKWISSIIRDEREACCDDMVMEYTSDKTMYLQALVNFHYKVLQTQNYAMALGGHNASLLNRMKRMLTYENNKLNIMEKILLFSGVILFTTFGIISAQSKIQSKAPAPPSVKIIQPVVPSEPVIPLAPVLPQPSLTLVNNIQTVVFPVPEQPAIPSIVKDTIPKSGYTTITNNIQINETRKTADYVLRHESGKHYKIRKVNGVLTDFYINDVRIADSELTTYKTLLDELDQVIQRDEELAVQRRQETKMKREEARKMKEIMQMQRREEMETRVSARNENIQIQREKMDAQRELVDVQRTQQEEQKLQLKQKNRELNKTSQSKNEANLIIEELLKEGVISDNRKLEFTLDFNTLNVNGVKQSTDLHNKLKEKFLNKDGDYIKYSKDPNNTNIRINRN